MKPVVLPMLHLAMLHLLPLKRSGTAQQSRGLVRDVGVLTARHFQHALEFMREDFDKTRDHLVPVVEDRFSATAAGQLRMTRDEILYELCILFVEQRLEIDGVKVAALFGEVSTLVEDVGDAAAHASRKISAARAEDEHQSVGHVFAAVIADTFDNGGRSGVADGEALAGDSVEERFPAGRSVEGDVADQNVFFGREARIRGGYTTSRPPERPLPT